MKVKQSILLSSFSILFGLATPVAMAEQYGKDGKHHKNYEMCEHHKDKNKKGKHTCKHHGKKRGMHHKKGQHGMKYMAKELGLNEQQQKDIQELKKQKRETIQSLRKQLSEMKTQIKGLDPQSNTYKSDIFSFAEKKGVLVQRMVVEKGEMRFKISSVLTPEQRAKKKEMKKYKKRLHKGCHHGKGHHKGFRKHKEEIEELKQI